MWAVSERKVTDYLAPMWAVCESARLVVLLRQEAEKELSHSQEVDHLCDAKEGSNDQSTAVRPLQESRGTLLAQNLPVKQEGRDIGVYLQYQSKVWIHLLIQGFSLFLLFS